MELYKEILAYALLFGEVKVTFPDGECDLAKLVEGECYQALQKSRQLFAMTA